MHLFAVAVVVFDSQRLLQQRGAVQLLRQSGDAESAGVSLEQWWTAADVRSRVCRGAAGYRRRARALRRTHRLRSANVSASARSRNALGVVERRTHLDV